MPRWLSSLFGGTATPSPTPEPPYLTEALEFEASGDLDGALSAYQSALRMRPNDPLLLQHLGIACSKLGRLDDAMRYYRRALEIDSDAAGAHYGLAFLYLRRGNMNGAARHLDAFLANAPEDAEPWVEYARATLDELHYQRTTPRLRFS